MDGHARPYGGVPPHAAPLLAVRALGRGIGVVLGPRKAPLPTAIIVGKKKISQKYMNKWTNYILNLIH